MNNKKVCLICKTKEIFNNYWSCKPCSKKLSAEGYNDFLIQHYDVREKKGKLILINK